ncbi:MAG: YicC family protein [Acidobacteria bacterium]|nr:YicC family protein [Acidobacteriota bacterium]
MMRSMTGFAAATADDPRGTVSVTIRTVNHRFLDLQLRLPPVLADLEPRVRALVQRGLARGRVELQASVQARGAAAPVVELNESFVTAVTSAIEVARAAGLVQGALTPGDLLRLPQALAIRERSAEAETGAGWAEALESVVGSAVTALDDMRSREGALLKTDLGARKRTLVTLIDAVVVAAEAGRVQLEARLLERARDLSASLPIDQASLAQEVVRAAQRSDISEEVTRFRAHLEHWDALTDGDEPCGRKLDFLLQEMNREINTIGSKADGLQVSEHIIDVKAELERMREQVQNVE